ncbi:SULTR4 [Symbiodinium sp. KB8]|nr:SULTR4 [Symbiodinium sp. KB8]
MAGTLRICTPGGQELELPFSESDTVAKVKDDIIGRMDEPVAHLRLLHGVEELKNDWLLSEHGITNGTVLTQVISAFPSGTFKLFGGGRARGGGPAGRNTSAEVEAEFRSDGTFRIHVHEREITSLVQGPDWDPYKWRAAFDHDYEGKASIEQLPEILLLVSRCTRKGIFKEPEPVELMGEICPDAEDVKLKLPFEEVDEEEPPLEDQLAAAKKHSDISEQYSTIEQELRESTDVESGGLPCPVCRAVIPSKRLPKCRSAPTSGAGQETRSSVGALPADLLRQVRKLQEQHTAILARRRQKEEAEAQAAEAQKAKAAAAEQQKIWSDSEIIPGRMVVLHIDEAHASELHYWPGQQVRVKQVEQDSILVDLGFAPAWVNARNVSIAQSPGGSQKAAWRGPPDTGAQECGRADWTDWTQSNATRFGKGKGKGKVQSSNSGYDSHAQEGQSRNRWGRRSGGAHGCSPWQRVLVVFLSLVWWTAFLFTLFFGAFRGILGAVFVSLLLVLYQVADPPIARLGFSSARGRWLNMKAHGDAQPRAGIVAFRLEGPLFYANVERLEEWLAEVEVAASLEGQPVKAAAMPFVDTTALESLKQLVKAYRKRNITFLVSNACGQPQKILQLALGDSLWLGSNVLYKRGRNKHGSYQLAQLVLV